MVNGYEAAKAETMAALNNPQVGDSFHELFSFWLYVLEVTPGTITIISAKTPCIFPDDGVIQTFTKAEFISKFTYKDFPGETYLLLGGRGTDVEGWLLNAKGKAGIYQGGRGFIT